MNIEDGFHNDHMLSTDSIQNKPKLRDSNNHFYSNSKLSHHIPQSQLMSDPMLDKFSKGYNNDDSFDIDNDYKNNIDSSDMDNTLNDSNLSANNDNFIEYQLNKPTNLNKEIIEEINHDFKQIKKDYIKNENSNNNNNIIDDVQLDNVDTSPISPTKELDINDDDDSMDEWKEIDTQLNCDDIYNNKGEKIEFVHSKDDLTLANTAVSSTNLHSQKKSNLQKISKVGSSIGKKTVQITAGVKLGKDEKEIKLREKYQKAHLINSDNTMQGYTRIDEERQAIKFNEMDKKFDFLFQNENNNLRKLHNNNNNSTNVSSASIDSVSKITDDFMNNDNFDEIFNNQGRDENELNPSIQMMSTKSMLTDSQKIAYASLVKLIIVQLNTDLIKIRGSNSTKILKKLSVSHTSFMRWSMNIMNELYKHLDIKNKDEINMIETLSCHGVESNDLAKSFEKNVYIENHLNDTKKDDNEKDELNLINIDEKQIHDEKTIEIDIKWTLICDLFLILLETSVYDSRSRTLLINFANSIGIETIEIYQFERRITDSLEIDEAFEILNNNLTWDESDILKEHKRKAKNSKIVKIALATAAGGLVIGLSAGALAPVIGAGLAAGLTTVGITGTSGFLAGAGGTAIITTTGVMSGMRAGKNAMSNRVGSVKTFEFIPLHNNRRVNLIITVSGWMSGTMDDIRLPFSTVDQVMGDLYSLLWEPEMLTSMGQTINILANEILTQSIQQILGSTLLITLMAGLQLPMMLSKLGYLLDNPWNNSLDRAWRSGKVLADTLRRNKLGVRPITLVGFSLGARLIYSCLLSLAKSGDFGIVENVYLFGSPIVIHDDEMAQVRSVVSGRFVNGYMKQDWILGYLFRATSGGLRSIAGLSPINSEDFNVENFNCSEFVKGHMQYREAMPKLLKEIGWEVLDDQFVEIEQPNTSEEERQRKLLSDFEKAQNTKKKKTWYNKIFGRKNKEWWEMYEEGEKEKKEKEKGGGREGEGDSTDGNDGNFDLEALKEEIANIEKEAQKIEKEKKDEEEVVAVKVDKVVEDTEKTPKIEKESVENEIIPKTQQNEIKFHLTPNSNKPTDAPIEVKKIRKRQSLIKLVESKDDSKKGDNFDKTDTLDINQNKPQLKSFRISSNTSRKSSFNKSPVVNLNIFQPPEVITTNVVKENDVKDDPNDEVKDALKDDVKDTKLDLKDFDFGEYEDPNNNGSIQIIFDDDIDEIEKKIKMEQSNHAGFGPVTGINYDDEEEFPQDESHVQFSFE